eukprot:TRINITY_DN330_c0_g1_i5.p1 TRINITY_DN330_c0_g1~~TRINITY_DN330_c0_g1_i5.p1  ORF type:complete len:310 (-),score=8.34 TRINITY_DN330_c0_g1_i5:157-1086(-)
MFPKDYSCRFLWYIIVVLFSSCVLLLLYTSNYDSLAKSFASLQLIAPIYQKSNDSETRVQHVVRFKEQRENKNITKKCSDKHDRCLFIIGMPRSGPLALLDILNQHPKIKLQGSNNGFFSTIATIFRDLTNRQHHGGNYISFVERGLKYAIAWYFSETMDDVELALIQLFNTWFRKGVQHDDYIGFIEQSFGKHDRYGKFRYEVDLLSKFCENPKIILHFDYDVDRVSNQQYWKNLHSNKAYQSIQRLVYFFNRYHHQHPKNTILNTFQDEQNESQIISQLRNVFQFLELEFNENEYNLTRFQGENRFF